MLQKKRLIEAVIPTSSMADIAFLLLIFFLVATVIDVDSGIGMTLPEYTDIAAPPSLRVINVLINENGETLINGEQVSILQIKDKIKPTIKEKINLPKNKKTIVSIKTDRRTIYNSYILALDQIKLAFYETRDELSEIKFETKFKYLDEEQQNEIKEAIPIIISIAEPEKIK